MNKLAYNKTLVSFIVLMFTTSMAISQSAKEISQNLSKPAQKGMLSNADFKEGDIVITYSMKVDKKSEQLNFENYVFDKEMNFKGIQPASGNKQKYPDKTVTTLSAYIGGTTSFTVTSAKLKIYQVKGTMSWNYRRQRYELTRRASVDKVNVKGEEGKYKGYAEIPTENGVFVIGSVNPDGKDAKEQFVAVHVNSNLEVKETKMTTAGNYSLVFYGTRKSGNPFAILAPKKKMPDLKQYVYAEFTPGAELVERYNFTSPSSNMVVLDYAEISGSLYFIGGSIKSDDPYEEEFTDISTIDNIGGANHQAVEYAEKLYKNELDNFHLLKITNNKLELASTTPVKVMEGKVVIPPGQKKANAFDGKGLYVQSFFVAPNGDILIGAQLMDKDFSMKTKSQILKYKDIVALHFNGKGEFKAQYAVDKMNDDTKSEIFESDQSFITSQNDGSVYWEILEVKGTKGYASYWDAYAGNKTFTPHYFPRVAKIDLANTSISAFTVLGDNGKFLMYKNYSRLVDGDGKTVYYIGHDDDYEKLWLAKLQLQ